MGLFDFMKGAASSAVNSEATRAINGAINKGVNSAVNAARGLGSTKHESFTFQAIPNSLSAMQALPESSLDSAFKTTALCVAALCNYGTNKEAMYEMLNFLKGPESLNAYEKQFLDDRLKGKEYTPFSFFEGANKDNNYTPSAPFKITVSSNPYSFDEENWATLYVKSAGADSPRPMKLRKKPSTNQWFINDIQILSDIVVPTSADPWA